MMAVFSVKLLDMHSDGGMAAKRLKKLLHQLCIEITDLLRRNLYIIV